MSTSTLYATIKEAPIGTKLFLPQGSQDIEIPAPGSGGTLTVQNGNTYAVTMSSPYATLHPANVGITKSYYFYSDFDERTWTIYAASQGLLIDIPNDAIECHIVVNFLDAYTYDTHTVTLNANGGSVSPSSFTIQNGQSYGSVGLPTATRSGYTFLGWFTDPNGGVQVTNQTGCMLAVDQTLYAHWSQNEIPEVVVDKDLTVHYAPINPNMSPTISGDTWTLLFSKYEPVGTNGYFNAFKVSYNGVDSGIYGLSVYSSSQTINLTRDGELLKWGNVILLDNLPSVTACIVTFTCLCSLSGHEPWVGKTFNLSYDQQGPTTTITDVSIKYPNKETSSATTATAYLPSENSTLNVCLRVELSGDIEDDAAITTKSITISKDGSYTRVFSTPEGHAWNFKLDDVQLVDGDNKFTVEITNSTVPAKEIILKCIKLNNSYADIKVREIVAPEVLRTLVDELKKVTDNNLNLYPGGGLNIDTLNGQLVNDKVILDNYSTDTKSFYQLLKDFETLYKYIVDNERIFKPTAGADQSPMKSDTMQFVLDPVLPGGEQNNDVLYLYDRRDVNADELDNQTVNTDTELRTDPEYASQLPYNRLIVSEPYSSSHITNNQLVVLNNYQQAMLYIIENIL